MPRVTGRVVAAGQFAIATADEIGVTTTGFNGHLSATDTTVQSALDTLDDIGATGNVTITQVGATYSRTDFGGSTFQDTGIAIPAAGALLIIDVTRDAAPAGPGGTPPEQQAGETHTAAITSNEFLGLNAKTTLGGIGPTTADVIVKGTLGNYVYFARNAANNILFAAQTGRAWTVNVYRIEAPTGGGGGGGRTLEELQDAVAAMFTGNTEFSYDDNAGTVTYTAPVGSGTLTVAQFLTLIGTLSATQQSTARTALGFPIPVMGSGSTLPDPDDYSAGQFYNRNGVLYRNVATTDTHIFRFTAGLSGTNNVYGFNAVTVVGGEGTSDAYGSSDDAATHDGPQRFIWIAQGTFTGGAATKLLLPKAHFTTAPTNTYAQFTNERSSEFGYLIFSRDATADDTNNWGYQSTGVTLQVPRAGDNCALYFQSNADWANPTNLAVKNADIWREYAAESSTRASASQYGTVELATNAEARAGTDTQHAVTPSNAEDFVLGAASRFTESEQGEFRNALHITGSDAFAPHLDRQAVFNITAASGTTINPALPFIGYRRADLPNNVSAVGSIRSGGNAVYAVNTRTYTLDDARDYEGAQTDFVISLIATAPTAGDFTGQSIRIGTRLFAFDNADLSTGGGQISWTWNNVGASVFTSGANYDIEIVSSVADHLVPGGGLKVASIDTTSADSLPPAWRSAIGATGGVDFTTALQNRLNALDVRTINTFRVDSGNLELEWTDGSGGSQERTIPLSSFITNGSIDNAKLATALQSRIPPATGTTGYVLTKTATGSAWQETNAVASATGSARGDLLATGTLTSGTANPNAQGELETITWTLDGNAPTRFQVASGATYKLRDDRYDGSNDPNPLWADDVIGLWFVPLIGTTEYQGFPIFLEETGTKTLYFTNGVSLTFNAAYVGTAHAFEYKFTAQGGNMPANATVRVYEMVVRGARGPGASAENLPDAVNAAMFTTAPTVQVGASTNAWGSYERIWRYTNGTEAKKFLFNFMLVAEASWTGSGGGDRAAVEYQIVRSNASGVTQETLADHLYGYIRNGDNAYGEVARASANAPSVVVDLEANENLDILARATAQERSGSTFTVTWGTDENYVSRQELTAHGGGSSGGGAVGGQSGATGIRVPQFVIVLRRSDSTPSISGGSFSDAGLSPPTGWIAPGSAPPEGTGNLYASMTTATYSTVNESWTLGSWSDPFIADAFSTQFSADSSGSSPTNIPDANSRYYRVRDAANGQWSAWLPINPNDSWTMVIDTNMYAPANSAAQVYNLPAALDLADLHEIYFDLTVNDGSNNFLWSYAVVVPIGGTKAAPVATTGYLGDSSWLITTNARGGSEVARANNVWSATAGSTTHTGIGVTFRQPSGITADTSKLGSVILFHRLVAAQRGRIRMGIR